MKVVVFMKVNGSMIRDMAWGMRDTRTVIYIRGSLKEGKLMGRGSTCGTILESSMKEGG
jgi:hypothetical protein